MGGAINPPGIVEIQPGSNITVDNTDPLRPVVSASGGGGGFPSAFATITGAGAILPGTASHNVGAITHTSTGRYSIAITGGVFTAKPTAIATLLAGGVALTIGATANTATQILVNVNDTSGTPTDASFNLFVTGTP